VAKSASAAGVRRLAVRYPGRTFGSVGRIVRSFALEGSSDAPVTQPSTAEAAPESSEVPDDFTLAPLTGSPRLQGSVWLARILWALEYARRAGTSPITAAEIARALSDNGVKVPGTNTARAFRTPRDDPRRSGLCEESEGQRYAITPKGRRVFYEWLVRTTDAE
jgi:hypothetical protein